MSLFQNKSQNNAKAPARAMVLSRDPNKAIQEMMSTIDSMRTIYKRETEALQAADARAFLGMQEEKLKAARAYQDGVEQIMERGDEMKKANPALKNRLQEMKKDFSELTTKNMEALQRMHRVTERLGNTIRVAARDTAKQQRAVSYGETGALKASDRKTVSMGISETA